MLFMEGLYRDAGNNSGGGSGQGDSSSGGGQGFGTGDLEARLLEAFNNLANRQGGQDAAGIVLLQENRSYRERIRALEGQVQGLQGQLPGEGAVVLNSEQAQLWTRYQELGNPDDLATLRQNYTTMQRDDLYRQAAEAHGFKAGVLGQLPGMADLSLDIREVEQDGNKRKVAFVKIGEEQEQPLPDYVKEHWTDFLPALQAEPQQQGTQFVKQHPGGSGSSGDMVTDYLDQQRKAQEGRKNPLQKQ